MMTTGWRMNQLTVSICNPEEDAKPSCLPSVPKIAQRSLWAVLTPGFLEGVAEQIFLTQSQEPSGLSMELVCFSELEAGHSPWALALQEILLWCLQDLMKERGFPPIGQDAEMLTAPCSQHPS